VGCFESAFNSRDLFFTYQYAAFGVPGLGMKRGLGEDLVIAPYATALAAMYLPHAAVENFEHLKKEGALGRFGFYEALDFTPIRLAEGQRVAKVRCYMAHHQGMSLVAIANAVHDGAMRHRFHRAPLIQAPFAVAGAYPARRGHQQFTVSMIFRNQGRYSHRPTRLRQIFGSFLALLSTAVTR
jgi:cyclic beta-1,2-glucan synthetase